MPHLDTFPYLIFDESLVQAEDWLLNSAGHKKALPMAIGDWDPLTDISLSRTVFFDFPEIFKQCGLTKGAEIYVASSWHATGTALKRRSLSPLTFSTTTRAQSINLEFTVKGSDLAGSLQLVTRVLLKKSGRDDDPLAALRTGSILWQDVHQVDLEGTGARFPIQFADFSELGFPAEGGWRLYWKKDDLHSQFMGNIWLLINERHERLRSILSGSAIDPEGKAIRATVNYTVARDLLVGALENDEFLDEGQAFPRGSVGEAIRNLMQRMFGDESPDSVLQHYRMNRDWFDCVLQAKLGLFQSREGPK